MRLPDPAALESEGWLDIIEETAEEYRNALGTLNTVTKGAGVYDPITDTGGGLTYTPIWTGLARVSLLGENESYGRDEWNVRTRYHIDVPIRDKATGTVLPRIEKGMVFIFTECAENPQLVDQALYVHSVSLGSQVSQLDIIASTEAQPIGNGP